MTRQRDILSNPYRNPNQVNLTLPQRPGILRYQITGAARLTDAYGTVMGTTGAGTLPLFEVENGGDYRSKSILTRRLAVEESNRKLTRMVFDPDDFATAEAPGAYLPSDDNTIFLRVSPFDKASATYLPEGPIVIIPPFDFFTTKEPVLTVTAQAPNLAIGAFPPNIPPTLIPGVLNFLIPAYSTTISIRNLDPVGGTPLFVSFHPGTPPTVIPAAEELSLTGAGVPEFFVAAPNGNPWFTVRCAVVNSA